jgi:hypothetical protein
MANVKIGLPLPIHRIPVKWIRWIVSYKRHAQNVNLLDLDADGVTKVQVRF